MQKNMKARCLLSHLEKTRTKPAYDKRMGSMLIGVTLTLWLCAIMATKADAQVTGSPLTITNEPAPPNYDSRQTQQYRQGGTQAQNWPQERNDYRMQSRSSSHNSEQFVPPESTHVSKKIRTLRKEYREIASMVKNMRGRFGNLEQKTRTRSNTYFADIAALNTQLQTGTTPGNPRLVRRLDAARSNLDSLSQILADMNALSMDVEDVSSRASALMENIRAAYNISGAVEADHAALTRLEDDVQGLLITLDRLQKKVSDSMTRMRAYLSSESENLRTLSVAVANGNYYGRSLSYRPFSKVPKSSSKAMVRRQASASATQDYAQPEKATSPALQTSQSSRPRSAIARTKPGTEKRPVMKIRFTKPNVNYEQALYTAISDAQKKYPDANFELVAVYPENGNDARSAIESTRARRNAEEVLRQMREMGLPARSIELSRKASNSANTSEVHIYLRQG